MMTARPPRLIHGSFPHLCPGEGCAVCAFVMTRDLTRRLQRLEPRGVLGRVNETVARDAGVLVPSGALGGFRRNWL